MLESQSILSEVSIEFISYVTVVNKMQNQVLKCKIKAENRANKQV